MKKLAIFWISLGSALCVSAEAQPTVQLYGMADSNLRVDHTKVGTLKSLGSGGMLASRWGLRGSEVLGSRLKANVVFEQGFDIEAHVALRKRCRI